MTLYGETPSTRTAYCVVLLTAVRFILICSHSFVALYPYLLRKHFPLVQAVLRVSGQNAPCCSFTRMLAVAVRHKFALYHTVSYLSVSPAVLTWHTSVAIQLMMQIVPVPSPASNSTSSVHSAAVLPDIAHWGHPYLHVKFDSEPVVESDLPAGTSSESLQGWMAGTEKRESADSYTSS